jgi:hypothetical protein
VLFSQYYECLHVIQNGTLSRRFLSLGNVKELHCAKSGVYGGCSNTNIYILAKSLFTGGALWEGPL